jgi:hypothetical protein
MARKTDSEDSTGAAGAAPKTMFELSQRRIFRARAGDHHAPTDYVALKLRIRAPLVKKLQKEADKKKQSANSEAVERLERSFSGDAQEMRDTQTLDLMLGMVAKKPDIKDALAVIIDELANVDLSAIDAKEIGRSVRVAISSAATATAAWKHDIETHGLKPEPKRTPTPQGDSE